MPRISPRRYGTWIRARCFARERFRTTGEAQYPGVPLLVDPPEAGYDAKVLGTPNRILSDEERAWRRKRSLAMVCGCTVFGAAAQILMKTGANAQEQSSVAALALAILTDIHLFSGYAMYGLSTLMLIVALKDGELSVLYPVIALTYVWVTVLSVFMFHEVMNPFKVAGLATVVIGVAILGGGRRAT